MSNLFKGAALFVGGALVGAAAALLLAPKSGEETRKELADLAEEAKKHAQDYCERVKKELAEAEAAIEARLKSLEPEAKSQEPKAKKPKKEA